MEYPNSIRLKRKQKSKHLFFQLDRSKGSDFYIDDKICIDIQISN